VRSAPLPPKGRESTLNLTRLAYDQRPRAHQRDHRQSVVFDSGGRLIGRVANVYVDDDRNFRFLGVSMRRGFEHLVPVEVIAKEDPVSITLTIDQQTVESAPTLGDPHAAPDEGLQRAAREHSGLGAVTSES
jgi:hypothetical protein